MRKGYGRKLALGACATVALCLLGQGEKAVAARPSSIADLENILGVRDNNVYVGLSYSPTLSKIVGFKIGAADGSTRAIYPNLHGATTLMSGSFNWNVQNPRIRFGDSMLFAFEGGFGYREGNARIELEIGYKKFETQAQPLNGKNARKDSIYLLAKELPYNVVSGQTDRLSLALAKVTAHDIVAFARVVGRQAKNIDNKICNRKGGAWINKDVEAYGAWSCDELSYSDEQGRISKPGYGLSYRFGDISHHHLKRPGSRLYYSGRGWPGTTEENIKTAVGMAEDLTGNLDKDERAVIAGILSKTISGAEIVEIHAITSASVMANACYDFQGKRSFVIPFVCAGVGVNFVGIVEEHVTPKLSYKLKAGMSYKVTPRITAFANGFYHRILGKDGYYDLPAKRMRDDISPDGRTNHHAKASFTMSYIGAEVGLRVAF